jgi:hypothetical protein
VNAIRIAVESLLGVWNSESSAVLQGFSFVAWAALELGGKWWVQAVTFVFVRFIEGGLEWFFAFWSTTSLGHLMWGLGGNTVWVAIVAWLGIRNSLGSAVTEHNSLINWAGFYLGVDWWAHAHRFIDEWLVELGLEWLLAFLLRWVLLWIAQFDAFTISEVDEHRVADVVFELELARSSDVWEFGNMGLTVIHNGPGLILWACWKSILEPRSGILLGHMFFDLDSRNVAEKASNS